MKFLNSRLALLLALTLLVSNMMMAVRATDDDDDDDNDGEKCTYGSGNDDDDELCEADKMVICGGGEATTGSTESTTTEGSSTTSEASSTSTTSEPSSSESTTTCVCPSSTPSTSEASSTETTSESSSTETTSEGSSTGSTTNVTKEPCECQLMTGLKEQCEKELTVEEKSSFEECLNEVRLILVDVKVRKGRKMPKIGKALKKCCKKDGVKKGACKKLKYKKIGWFKVKFGSFISCGARKDQKYYSKKLFTFDKDGNCNATKAIEEGTKDDKCGAGTSEKIKVELNKCKKRLAKKLKDEDDNKSQKRKQGYFKKCIVKYLFKKYPDCEQCIRKCKVTGIKGFEEDDIDQVVEMCGSKQEVVNSIGIEIFKGISSLDCKFVKSLKKKLAEKAGSTDQATKDECDAYAQDVSNFCDTNSDPKQRHKHASDKIKLLSPKAQEHAKSCEIEESTLEYNNDTCDVGDCTTDVQSFCNYDCGDCTDEKCSSSLTLPEAVCADADNRSDVYDALTEYRANLTFTQQTQFWTTYASCQQCIWAAQPPKSQPPTPEGRTNCTMQYLIQYEKSAKANGKVFHDKFLAWPIYTLFYEVFSALSVVFEGLGYLVCKCRA